MYGVFRLQKLVLGGGCIGLALLIFLGVGRSLLTSAKPRELPIYSVEREEKLAALGINCAWDDSDIDVILSLLEERQVKATFFLVGDWCRKYPEAAQKLAQAGHELGSHSDTHPDMTKLSQEEIQAQLERSRETIQEVTGQTVRLFRPPSGAYNDLVVSTARTLGWEVIQWSNDSLDWKTPPVESMVERVCRKAAPGDILLWHAGRKNTPAALAQVLDQLMGQGYQFVTVGELIYPQPYTIDHTGRQKGA